MSEGHRAIGRRLKRPDSGPNLTGQERYVAGVSLSGRLHTCLARSGHASAIGVRLTHLPMTPARDQRALRERDRRASG